MGYTIAEKIEDINLSKLEKLDQIILMKPYYIESYKKECWKVISQVITDVHFDCIYKIKSCSSNPIIEHYDRNTSRFNDEIIEIDFLHDNQIYLQLAEGVNIVGDLKFRNNKSSYGFIEPGVRTLFNFFKEHCNSMKDGDFREIKHCSSSVFRNYIIYKIKKAYICLELINNIDIERFSWIKQHNVMVINDIFDDCFFLKIKYEDMINAFKKLSNKKYEEISINTIDIFNMEYNKFTASESNLLKLKDMLFLNNETKNIKRDDIDIFFEPIYINEDNTFRAYKDDFSDGPKLKYSFKKMDANRIEIERKKAITKLLYMMSMSKIDIYTGELLDKEKHKYKIIYKDCESVIIAVNSIPNVSFQRFSNQLPMSRRSSSANILVFAKHENMFVEIIDYENDNDKYKATDIFDKYEVMKKLSI